MNLSRLRNKYEELLGQNPSCAAHLPAGRELESAQTSIPGILLQRPIQRPGK
jgi:hypothetical protein